MWCNYNVLFVSIQLVLNGALVFGIQMYDLPPHQNKLSSAKSATYVRLSATVKAVASTKQQMLYVKDCVWYVELLAV